MKPSEIRDELLSQHAGIREQLEVARLAVDRWAHGDESQAHVRDDLSALADALRNHNLHEERNLREVLRGIDAWGPARLEILEEAHIREHRDLFDALIAVSQAQDPHDGVKELATMHARLMEHMGREEKAFLNEEVLRDDDVAIDGQGG